MVKHFQVKAINFLFSTLLQNGFPVNDTSFGEMANPLMHTSGNAACIFIRILAADNAAQVFAVERHC